MRHWDGLFREAQDAPSMAVQGQAGWGAEQHAVVGGVPAQGRGVGTG